MHVALCLLCTVRAAIFNLPVAKFTEFHSFLSAKPHGLLCTQECPIMTSQCSTHNTVYKVDVEVCSHAILKASGIRFSRQM